MQVAELLLQEGARVNAADMYDYQVWFCLYVLSSHCNLKHLYFSFAA